jgi:hypothetical protein
MTPENERKKAWLCRYLEVKRDQLALEHELEQYRLSALPSGISYDGVGGGGSVPHGYEVYAAKLDEYFLELSAQIATCQRVRRETIAAIESLPSEAERTLMKMRYIFLDEIRSNGNVVGYRPQRFESIAFRMDYTIDRIWHIHGEALAHLQLDRQ